ncbi:hypothetical protein G5B30_16825 [Sphingobacterium sp. SGG-5]|uniref:hypothetical protein n=1 Tax=Sphingobacterium sp. SGG-5 TaxID=2710881 RepID=UPI0013E9EB54|nr:hypothetical protein [Sphingobacterium sp. SGG-5]NGM63575.1 hypothetical protein [Sphingobacterium sp. SGG-5]
MINVFHLGVIFLISMPLYSMGQIQTKALMDLRSLLYSEKEWVKVHAAEFLIWEKQAVDEVRDVFLKEEKQSGDLPKYRIGIWRVLAQTAVSEEDRRYWIDKIIAAYQNPEGEDRLHAIETLAKLKVPVVEEIDSNLEGSMRLYSLWNYAMGSKQRRGEVKALLVANLINGKLSELEMQVSSYIFRYLGPLSNSQFREIYQWMQRKDLILSLRSNLLATLWMVFPINGDKVMLNTLKKELLTLQSQPEALNHVMMGLATCGGLDDSEIIRGLYNAMRDKGRAGYNSDLHAAAAYMVLKVRDVK